MTFDEKLTAAKEMLAAKGLPRASYAPSLVAFLWRLGLKIPPPHFAGFLGVFLISGGTFAVGWGALMWLLYWSRHGTPFSIAATLCVVLGVITGLCYGFYYRISARKNSIPSWDHFPPDQNAPRL